MQILNLYKYTDPDCITITPQKRAESDEPSRYRLVADEEKVLYKIGNESKTYSVIDIQISALSEWAEKEK